MLKNVELLVLGLALLSFGVATLALAAGMVFMFNGDHATLATCLMVTVLAAAALHACIFVHVYLPRGNRRG